MQHTLSYQHTTRYNTIKRVLLVDDSPDDIALTRRALARAGFAVHLEVLQNKDTILTRIDTAMSQSQTNPDLILVDMNMSQADGFELIRAIRQQLPTMHTPIVVISTSDSEQEVLRCYEYGASSFIHKAIDFTEYAQTLREVCSYWLNLNISPTSRISAAS